MSETYQLIQPASTGDLGIGSEAVTPEPELAGRDLDSLALLELAVIMLEEIGMVLDPFAPLAKSSDLQKELADLIDQHQATVPA